MATPSETRVKNLFIKDGKVKCGQPGRAKGKTCSSTVMIDGEIVCSAGHKISLDDLMAANSEGTEGLLARAMFACSSKDTELARELIKMALEEKFSPPFSLPKPKDGNICSYFNYHWTTGHGILFNLLLNFADLFYPQYAENLRCIFVERYNGHPLIKQALDKLNEERNLKSDALRDHIINDVIRFDSRNTTQSMALYFNTLIQACKIVDEELLWVYEDSLLEISSCLYGGTPVIFSSSDCSNSYTRDYFHVFVRYPNGFLETDPIFVKIKGMFCDIEYSNIFQYGYDISLEKIKNIAEEMLKKYHDSGIIKSLEISYNGDISIKDGFEKNDRWQLEVVKDLRRIFGYLSRKIFESVVK